MRAGAPAGAARAAAGAALLAAWLAGCATVDPNPLVVGAVSDRLSPYNYKEEGLVARLIVGVEGARFIRDEAYFPLFVQVANRSEQTFEVGRESFILEDALGRHYALTPVRELAEGYGRMDLDRRLFRQNRQFTANGVGLFTYVRSEFFPSTARRAILDDRVTVPPRTYIEDVLYFPVPEGGLHHVPLRLLFQVKGIEDPIQVVFEVPRTLGIIEKRRERDRPEGGPP
jgi:hypothetical protein